MKHQPIIDSQIITICDIYDALTSDRPYRAAMPDAEAMAILAGEVGGAIDGDCLDALRAIDRS